MEMQEIDGGGTKVGFTIPFLNLTYGHTMKFNTLCKIEDKLGGIVAKITQQSITDILKDKFRL